MEHGVRVSPTNIFVETDHRKEKREHLAEPHIFSMVEYIDIKNAEKKTMEKNGKNSKLKISNKNTKTEEKKRRDSTQKT